MRKKGQIPYQPEKLAPLLFMLLTLLVNSSLKARLIQDQIKAEEVIEKSIQAQGGRQALEQIKDTVVTLSCKFYLPQGEILGERKIYSQAEPYKIRIEDSLLGMQVIMAFDGEKTWLQQMGQTMLAPEAINNSIKTSAARENLLLKYKQKGCKVEYLGESQIEARRVYQIKILCPDIGETFYYFDSETFLPLKIEFKAPNESGQIVKNEILNADFKKIENIVLPWKTVVLTDGRKTLEAAIQEVKFNQGLADSLFAFPEKSR